MLDDASDGAKELALRSMEQLGKRLHCTALVAFAYRVAADPERVEAQLGDLAEEFAERAERDRREARSWYRRQVVRSLLPSLRHRLTRWHRRRRHDDGDDDADANADAGDADANADGRDDDADGVLFFFAAVNE